MAFVATLGQAADASPIKDEKIKRFQSVTLNGQVKDKPYLLKKVAARYSNDRLCLVIFGDPDDERVTRFRTKSTEMLKRFAAMGYNMALLHVDTSVYKEGPKDFLFEEELVYASPSAVMYVDGFQATYHEEIDDNEVEVIHLHMYKLNAKLMGWKDKFLELQSSERDLEAKD